MKNFFKDRESLLLFRLPATKDWAFWLFVLFLSINIFIYVTLGSTVQGSAVDELSIFKGFNLLKLVWYTYLYFLPVLIIRLVINGIRLKRSLK